MFLYLSAVVIFFPCVVVIFFVCCLFFGGGGGGGGWGKRWYSFHVCIGQVLLKNKKKLLFLLTDTVSFWHKVSNVNITPKTAILV